MLNSALFIHIKRIIFPRAIPNITNVDMYEDSLYICFQRKESFVSPAQKDGALMVIS